MHALELRVGPGERFWTDVAVVPRDAQNATRAVIRERLR
jgi:hypothetical protein